MKNAKDIILKKSKGVKSEVVKGYNLDNGFDFAKVFDSYKTTGLMASDLYKGCEIWREMNKQKDIVIFFGFTSNTITSGLREYICWLTKHKKIGVLITSAGGIEEDIIKLLYDFVLGDWIVDDVKLRDAGLNRSGNILAPNEGYIRFEKFMTKFFTRIYAQKDIWTPRDFIYELGREIERELSNKEESYIYWTYKNNIPVFSQTILDGSIGDMLYFFNQTKQNKLKIDIASDDIQLKNIAVNAAKTGSIILGGGTPKHQVTNTNIFRDGADYAVYITNANAYDGSVSGSTSNESISWGKVSQKAKHVDVFCDFSIAFPLLVYGVFREEFEKKKR